MIENGIERRIKLLGTSLTLCSDRQLLRAIRRIVEAEDKAIVLSGNVHSFNIAYRTPWFQDFFNRADIVRLDGFGLAIAAKILGHRNIPRRITWADFAWDLAQTCESYGLTLFLAGGRPGIAAKAAARLKERFLDLAIAGTHHGYFDKTAGCAENEAVIQRINAARPNILIVGFGMPVQEKWLIENLGRIDVNVVLTGGAVFDYISGTLRRGPRWMTKYGLEWLARLFIEPRRLWKRYLIGNPVFLWRIILERFGLFSFEEETTKR